MTNSPRKTVKCPLFKSISMRTFFKAERLIQIQLGFESHLWNIFARTYPRYRRLDRNENLSKSVFEGHISFIFGKTRFLNLLRDLLLVWTRPYQVFK